MSKNTGIGPILFTPGENTRIRSGEKITRKCTACGKEWVDGIFEPAHICPPVDVRALVRQVAELTARVAALEEG